jgi:predicted nucleic acid-binding protein
VTLVLDSSVTLAWIYSDETTEPIRHIFQAVADDGAVVPTLWRLEIANSLTVAMRRGRIDANLRRAALADLPLLDITTDEDTDAHAWGETMNMADRFQLTLYDTAYLELAQRRPLRKLTGIPMVLNTSFNENEPVVCTPAEASIAFCAPPWISLSLEMARYRAKKAAGRDSSLTCQISET